MPNATAIVVLNLTDDDIELMRRYVWTSSDNDDALTMSKADVVDEFAHNAIDNMLDNCHELRSAGELDELPAPPEETP